MLNFIRMAHKAYREYEDILEKMSMVKYSELNTDPHRQHMKIAERIGYQSTVLDIGCGSGQLLEYLKNTKNCKVYGIDIDKESVLVARSKGVNAFVMDAEKPWAEAVKNVWKDVHFDYIICADVVEHLVAPEELVDSISTFLYWQFPHSKVIFSIPNFQWLPVRTKVALGKFEYEDYGPLDRTHLKFFSYKTAKQLLKRGFKVEHEDYSIKKFWHIPQWVQEPLAIFWPNAFSYQFIFECTYKDQIPLHLNCRCDMVPIGVGIGDNKAVLF